MKTLSIIIPAYNEEVTVLELLKRVKNSNIKHIKKEIILIDDGSTDATHDLVADRYPDIKLIRHEQNKGKGYAIRTGLKVATGDIILIQDADLEYDPDDYWELIKPILELRSSVVYGSRRLMNQTQYSGISFYMGGIFLTWFANLLFPRLNITDEPTCMKVFHRSVFDDIKLECTRFEFCPEVTAKLANKKYFIYEVPIKYYPRSKTEGKKINWRDGIEAVWTLIKLRVIGWIE